MRPELVAWAARFGVPSWLVPSYWVLAGLAALVGAEWARRWAKRDGADVHAESAAHLWGYAGAMVGGFVYEGLRHAFDALRLHSASPLFAGGRAAYGGLLFGVLGAAIALHHRRVRLAGFFDRVTLAIGAAFVAVRTGCFLSGCDYGHVTAGPLGVRFPAWSAAAVDHTAHGWIPAGAASLPVHATQLYEVVVALIATAICWAMLRASQRRDGWVFATWMGLYAIGRFGIELMRADVSRGAYGGVSTAQWTSIAIVTAIVSTIGGVALRRWIDGDRARSAASVLITSQ